MSGRTLRYFICVRASLAICLLLSAQPPALGQISEHLQVETGTPLRLYITKRVWYRKGNVVQAKFVAPVWAFDRIVIPAGATAQGEVFELRPVPVMVRAMAVLRGDFTPLKRAQVHFTNLLLPDGRSLPFDAQPSFGLETIYAPPSPVKKTPPKKPARSGKVRSFLQGQVQGQANARAYGLLDAVRGQNRIEWLQNFLLEKLPYHPQWYRSRTRFDAILDKPLDFGNVSLPANTLDALGKQPAPDTPANIRFLSTVSSGEAQVGDPVTGILSEPLFSPNHQLVLPEGTRLTGKVRMARPARMFHRGGQLRFAFEGAELPVLASAETPHPELLHAELTQAEPLNGSLKVDAEGTARTTESKTRLLRPVIAGLVASRSMDNDAGKQGASGGANANYSGRGLGGFSGFGLLGTALSRGPRPIGIALGFYGLAWSVYTNVVSRGKDVIFEKNTAMAIRFGAPTRGR